VTGAAGFLGSRIVEKLSEFGAEVHAVSRTAGQGRCAVNWISTDLSDPTHARHIVESIRPALIIHLAGHGFGTPDLEHVIPTFHNDVASAVNILVASAKSSVERIIIPRSLEEPDDDPSAVPGSPYAAAKWTVSTYAKMFYKLYAIPIVMVRPFMTYGPGQKLHKVIPYCISAMLRGEAPKIASGRRLVDWIYVDDVVDGVLSACLASDVEGSTLDLGSGELVSIQSAVSTLAKLMGKETLPVFGAIADRPVERVRAADVETTYQKLGWRSCTTLEAGFAKTIDWYTSAHLRSMSVS
jgi:UDP-glucose 4-epimerase